MEYRFGNQLDLDQVTELYRASTLGERRPIDDPAIVRSMLEHANLVATAWDGDLLVGISRTLTDFAYVGYLADLAVRESHQRQGLGLALIQKTRERMGAAVDARIDCRSKGGRLLPASGLQAARERVGSSGFRTPGGQRDMSASRG